VTRYDCSAPLSTRSGMAYLSARALFISRFPTIVGATDKSTGERGIR
jgi:hypothetical protein